MQESSASTQGPEKDASQRRLFLQRADRINRLSGGAHKDDADDEWLMWWRGAIIKPPPPKAPQRVLGVRASRRGFCENTATASRFLINPAAKKRPIRHGGAGHPRSQPAKSTSLRGRFFHARCVDVPDLIRYKHTPGTNNEEIDFPKGVLLSRRATVFFCARCLAIL
jgi:hypothetical protein